MVSAGKPATAVAGYPLLVVCCVAWSGGGVVLLPVPLWFVAGATTVIVTFGQLAQGLDDGVDARRRE